MKLTDVIATLDLLEESLDAIIESRFQEMTYTTDEFIQKIVGRGIDTRLENFQKQGRDPSGLPVLMDTVTKSGQKTKEGPGNGPSHEILKNALRARLRDVIISQRLSVTKKELEDYLDYVVDEVTIIPPSPAPPPAITTGRTAPVIMTLARGRVNAAASNPSMATADARTLMNYFRSMGKIVIIKG